MNGQQGRKRFQFSIWSLLVLMTVTAVVLSARYYAPKIVDAAIKNIIFYAIIILLPGLLVRGIMRLVGRGIAKLRPRRFAVYRFVARWLVGPLLRLFMRPGLAANYLGLSYFNEGQYEKAIAEWDRAIKLEGRKAAIPYCNRGLAWHKRRDFNAALTDYDASLRLAPRRAMTYFLRSITFFAKNEIDAAIADCDAAVRYDSKLVAAYIYRGGVFAIKGAPDKALLDFEQAITLKPRLLEARISRAYAWFHKGNYSLARADVDYVLQRKRNYRTALQLRGVLHALDGFRESAMVDLDRAIRLHPTDPQGYFARGYAWDHLKEYAKAIADYDEALRLAPTHADGFCDRGLSYFRQGDFARALTDFAEAIQLEPKYHIAYNNRGLVYTTRGQYELAQADLQKAIELAPEHPNAHKNLAWLMATCPDQAFRNGAKAVEHARRALDLAGHNDPARLDILAAAYAEAGDFDAALAWEQKAIQGNRDPQEAPAYQQRLELYRQRRPYRAKPSPAADE